MGYNFFASPKLPSNIPSVQDKAEDLWGNSPKTNTGVITERNAPMLSQPLASPVETAPIDSNDPQSGMDYAKAMLTTPEDERREYESSLNRRKVLAVGDALRHIGNIYNTVKGAPSQQFSSPVVDEERRYLGEKKERDARSMKYLSYEQAKARQDELARRYREQEEGRARRQEERLQSQWDRMQAQIDFKRWKAENDAEKKRELEERKSQLRREESEAKKKMVRTGRTGRTRTSSDTTTTTTYDENGNVKKTVVKKKGAGNGKKKRPQPNNRRNAY